MESHQWISKSDAVFLLEIVSDCLRCREEDQFGRIVQRLGAIIPYDCAICGYADIFSALYTDKAAVEYLNFGFPQEFVDSYIYDALYLEDIVLQEFFRTFEIIYWPEIHNRHPESMHSHVTRLALALGLRDGYTYGIPDLDKFLGTVFYVSAEPMEDHQRTRFILRNVIPHLSEALKRIVHPPGKVPLPELTPTEFEVVKWLMEGKSSWEISVILCKSQRVINFHVKNITEKLHAANRTHAVAIALANRLIEL